MAHTRRTEHSTKRTTLSTRLATTAGTVVVATALAAVLAACGSEDAPGGGGRSTSPTVRPPHSTTATGSGGSVTPPHDFPAAQRVTVVQSGGLKPATVMRVFAADRPVPKGFTRADVRAILRAAADPRLKSMPTTPPTDTCCDRYLYRITVTYPDGETLTFSLVDGGPTTAAAERLLRLVV